LETANGREWTRTYEKNAGAIGGNGCDSSAISRWRLRKNRTVAMSDHRIFVAAAVRRQRFVRRLTSAAMRYDQTRSNRRKPVDFSAIYNESTKTCRPYGAGKFSLAFDSISMPSLRD